MSHNNDKPLSVPLKTHITRDLQRYVDEPIYLQPKRVTAIEAAVQAAFSSSAKPRQRFLLGYQRVLLRWMKPDGHGGLVPREK